MKHICSNCIASEICYREGKNPNDTCLHWDGDMQAYGLTIKK